MDLYNEIKKDFEEFLTKAENRCTDSEKTKVVIGKITTAINDFFRTENLNACTLGISGGIDSAVVLALLVEAQKQPDSPLEKISPLSLPFNYVKGATDQESAMRDANTLTKALTGEPIQTIGLGEVYGMLLKMSGVPENDEYSWANGQMLSVMRTPALYHQAALLQKDGYRSIVVGTINETEFGLGYWGKASDMMVDLQIIINLLKFEVYNIARELGVPQEIIDRVPKGDVSTGETDNEMIGAPYEFLDIFMYDKKRNDGESIDYSKYVDFLKPVFEKQIYRNEHKFRVGYPCHFLNW